MIFKIIISVILIPLFFVPIFPDELSDKFFNAVKEKNIVELENCLQQFLQNNNKDSAETILDIIKQYDNSQMWFEFVEGYQLILFYLGEFTDPSALEAIAKFITKSEGREKDTSKDILRNIRPSDSTVTY